MCRHAVISSFLALTVGIGLTGCVKPRTIDLSATGPKEVTADSVVKGAILINEVNSRWGALNLACELSPALVRRYNATIGDDWKDGKVKWFELYNNTAAPITLGDNSKGFWYMSDNRTERKLSPVRIRITIPAKGFALVYSSDSLYSAGTELHAAFNVGRNTSTPRDTIGIYYQKTLSSPLMTIDSLTYAEIERTSTWGRVPDGGSTVLKTAPTPAAANRQ